MNTALMNTQEWQRLDSAHYLHPFTDHKTLAAKGARIITRADGVYIYTSDGHKILDGMSGLWCVALGYGRKELSDAAYRQMLELPYYNSFFQSSTPPAIELARILKEVTPPQFNHVFFTGSGSEANDTLRSAGAPLLAVARSARAKRDRFALEWISRQHRGGCVARRHETHARAAGSGRRGARHRAHQPALLVR